MIATTDRYLHGATSNPIRFETGEQLRRLILTAKKRNGLFEVFRIGLSLPFGSNTYQSLLDQTDEEMKKDILFLRSPMARHDREHGRSYVIPIFNPFGELPLSSIRLFRRAATNPRLLQHRASVELGVSLSWTFKRVCDALEAILPCRHSMALIAIFNFVTDAAQPTTLDLSLGAQFDFTARSRTHLVNRYPLFWRIVSSRANRRRKEGDYKMFIPDEEQLKAALPHDAALCRAGLAYLRRPLLTKGERSLSLTSVERYMYGFTAAYESLTTGRRLDYVGPLQAHSIRILSGLIDVKADLPFLTKLDPKKTRLLALINPILIEREYGLDRPYPSFDELVEATLRVALIILFHCGRRARCLLDVRLKDFKRFGSMLDLNIPTTKVDLKNQRLPLSDLLSQQDLTFVLGWLEYCRDSAALPGDSFLFDLLGIHRDGSLQPDVARSQMVQLLSRLLGKRGLSLSTHVPRHCFITWFLVRALIAHNLCLLAHPLLKDCIGHVWFSAAGLERFRKIVPSEVTAALAEMLPIVGHSMPTESIQSYGRSWALLAALNASLLFKEESY